MKNKIHFYEKGSIEMLYSESSHTFPLHSHESFCVGIVTGGEVLFRIQDKEKLVKENMVFVIPSNVGVSIEAKSTYQYLTICFKNKWRDQLLQYAFKDYYFCLEDKEEMIDLCRRFREDDNEELMVHQIEKWLCEYLPVTQQVEKNKKSEMVQAAVQYINEHIENKFNLEELASALYVSKFHFIRVFKKEMGVTPNQYHIQAKMRIVKRDIFAEKSETELAAALNFAEQSHLCNSFKKQMGISLRDYRNHSVRK